MIGNFIGYQAVWFIAVSNASRGTAWPAVAAATTFVSWQLLTSGSARADLRLLLVAVGAGCLVDGVLADGGWALYSAPAPAIPPHGAPIWILALWASFAMTLNRSLRYLRARPWLAAIFGVVGAPLAYWGAQQGWRAVVFQTPTWRGLAWLSGSWAIAMLLLATLATRWASPSVRAT